MDYFFYLTYRFAHLKLKKDKGDSKWSAFIHTGVYFAFLIISVICILGILIDNPISAIFKRYTKIFWMSIGIISLIYSNVRFYKIVELDEIEMKYLSKTHFQKKAIKWLISLIMLILPAISFIVFRLYVKGQIKWW